MKMRNMKLVWFFLLTLLSFGVGYAQTNTYAVATGNWSTAGNWSLTHAPVAGEDAVIPVGATVTIDVTAAPGTGSINSLTISGNLVYATSLIRTVTVANDVTINAGGSFTTGATGTATHKLVVGGNITNNGILDFSNNGNVQVANITFTGAANQTVSGTGSVTDLFSITMTKSALDITGATNTVELNLSNFSVRGLSAAATGALLTSNTGTGLIKISGTNTFSGSLWSTATYIIPATLGCWLNNPNFTVNALAGTATLSGFFRITNGVYNIGTAVGNSMTGTGTVIIEGGAVNVAAKFQNTGSYTQSGGTLTTAIAGNNSSASGSFQSSGSFTMSGGTIVLQNKATGATQLDCNISSIAPVITGGILQIGNSATPAAASFNIQGKTPSIVLDNSSGNNPGFATTASVTIMGDINLNGTGTFTKGAFPLIIQGNGPAATGNININGTNTLTLNTSATLANALSFTSSTGNQSFSLNGGTITAGELPSLTINNSFAGGTVTIPTGLAMTSGTTLTLSNGTLNTGTIDFGTAAAGTFTCVRTLGAMVAASSSFGTGLTTKAYTYNGAATQITGAELTTTSPAIINTLTINNAALNLSLDKVVNVNTTLTLTAGIVTTTNTNLLILGSVITAGTLTGGSAASYINGPFARTFLAGRTTAGTYTIATIFPVGKGGIYLPIYLDPATSASGAVQLQAEGFDTNTGTNISSFGTLGAHRWEATAIAGVGNLNNLFMRQTDALIVNTNTILSCTSAAGAYGSITSATAKAAGVVSTSISIPATEFISTGFFSFGNGCYPLPALTGPANVCVKAVSQLYAVAGATVPPLGNWTSSASGVATVDGSGNVTGVATGTATITFTVTSADACFSIPVTKIVNITSCSATPGGVGNNLISWYKGDAGLSASSWADQTGNNTVTGSATSVTNTLNFNPVATFNGTTDYYNNATADGWWGAANATTYYFVAAGTGAAGGKAVYSRGVTNSGTTSNHGGRTAGNAVYASGAVNTTPQAAGLSWLTQPAILSRGGFNGIAPGPFYVSANGGVEATAQNVTPVMPGIAPFKLGANTAAGALWAGSIAEVIAFNSKQANTDYNKVESYLALKYGITLDQTTAQNYIASDDITKMWDTLMAGPFNKNIFGIGRDNAAGGSGLDQKISQSVNTGNLLTVATTNDFAATNQDPSRTPLNNLNFETFADNNGNITWGNYGNKTGYALLQRQWKVQQTATAPALYMQFNMANTSFPVPALLKGTDYYLVTDPNADGDYSDGAIYTLTNTSSSFWATAIAITLVNGSTFTLASAAPAVAPGGVSTDLTLWLKADNITGASNNNPVSAWDNSFYGITKPTGTGATRPVYKDGNATPARNFNPSVYFGGANNLTFSDLAFNTGAAVNKNLFTAFFVSESDILFDPASPAHPGNNFIIQPTAGGNIGIGVQGGAGNNFALMVPNWGQWGPQSTPGTVKADSTNIYGFTYNGQTGSFCSINNLDYPTYTADPATYTFAPNSNLGGNGTSSYSPNFIAGTMQEVIMYNTASLTATKTQQINSYLALKYGITLNQSAATDYLASNGSTKMWNAAAASAGFNHNIFGIGRDDSSALNQKISKSQNAEAIVTVAVPVNYPFQYYYDFVTANQYRGTTLNNLSFETIADNGGTPTWGSSIVQSIYKTMNREWQVQETGTAGAVALQFDMANPAFTVPALETGTSYYLIYTDATGNYNTATVLPLRNEGGTNWATAAAVDFVNGAKFTLATQAASKVVNKICPGGVGEANGMQIWLKADAGLSTSGTTVTSWTNQAQPAVIPMTTQLKTIAGAHTLAPGSYNYNPSLILDGTGYLTGQATNTLPPGPALSFAVVNGIDINNSGLAGVFVTSGNNGNIMMNGAQYGTDGSGNSYYPTDWALTPNKSYLIGTEYTTPSLLNSYVRVDGKPSAPSAATTPGYAAGDGSFTLGIRAGGARYYAGKIAEVINYSSNGQITTAQKTKIESYLALKYGITLDNTGSSAGNYLLSNNTNVWNASVNPAYHRDVVAIVRDDTSALLQKQSRTQDDSLRVFAGNLAASNQANTAAIFNNYSSIVIGHDGGVLKNDPTVAKPATILYRLGRTWKITNTNFNDNFGIEIKWDSSGSFYISDLRLLVSDSPDFTSAAVYSSYDVNFYIGSIIVTGISPSIIPPGTTKYITIGSVSTFTTLSANITQFTATPVDNKWVNLNWQTDAEPSNDYFTIERSADAKTWKTVTTVNGAGNSSAVNTYSVVDKNPYTGLSYYRLKQTDIDGKYSYSAIRNVTISASIDNTVVVYPNPAAGQVTVKGKTAELRTMKIYNTTGQDVTGMTKIIETGNAGMVLDVSALTTGVYTIKTNSTVTKLSKK